MTWCDVITTLLAVVLHCCLLSTQMRTTQRATLAVLCLRALGYCFVSALHLLIDWECQLCFRTLGYCCVSALHLLID